MNGGEREIDAALDLLAPFHRGAAERCRAALGRLLAGVAGSAWPEVAWRFSELTGDGFPFLLGFSSRAGELRYTCEVAGPELPARRRLARAGELVSALSEVRIPAATAAFLERVQAAGPLAIGAWAGGGHGPAGDRFKVYAEVPEAAARQAIGRAEELLGGALRPGRPLVPRMIAYDPGARWTEIYFRAPGLEPAELPRLLRLAGLETRLDELLELEQAAWSRPLADGFPGDQHGLSLTFDGDGRALALTAFHYARAVFCGGDGAIRRRLLGLAESRGWELGDYAAASRPLAGRDGPGTFHDIVSFVAPRGERTCELRIGLRPPPELAAEERVCA